MHRPRLLFLCTGNSCRSQMAEGWMRHLHGDRFQVYSAGTRAQGLNPLAVRVMAEQGVPIDHHHSKTVNEIGEIDFDYVITVCDNASKNCPVFTGRVIRLHHPFEDPPFLARNARSPEEIVECYHRVCRQIRDWTKGLPDRLQTVNGDVNGL